MSEKSSITVIIPIYNAATDLKILCDSLITTYPNPSTDLFFIFSDDCSPDAKISALLAEHPFCQRSNVTVLRTPANGGFIKNVNYAIGKTSPEHDIVLLNSDTEIFGDVFRTLRREAYAYGKTGSVTPFTNNATIASIFGYPDGADLPKGISSKTIAGIVSELNLPTDQNPVPTGIGYCMYLTREAVNAVGVLDEVFGRGYGEECDWCRRAHKAGFKNLITPKAFVHHSGTKSFLSEEKLKYIRASSEILNSRHPEYDRVVGDYITANPYRIHRLVVWLTIAKTTARLGKLTLLTLHADPDAANPGGTELYVRTAGRDLLQNGHGVAEIHPMETSYSISVWSGEARLGTEVIPFDQWALLLALLGATTDCLFINHTMNWSPAHLLQLTSLDASVKVAFAHDFFFICPGINLINTGGRFCDIEKNLSKCDVCSRHFKHGWMGIGKFRENSLELFSRMDSIYVPSDNTERLLSLALPEVKAKIRVLPLTLSHTFVHADQDDSTGMENDADRRPVVAFVGAIGAHKGAALLRDSHRILHDAGFDLIVLGKVDRSVAGDMTPAIAYKGTRELKNCLRIHRPDIVVFASNCPETYCYSFYESLILSRWAIPVVGPLGNPADVVRRHEMGVVIPELTPGALLEGCQMAMRDRSRLFPRVKSFLSHSGGELDKTDAPPFATESDSAPARKSKVPKEIFMQAIQCSYHNSRPSVISRVWNDMTKQALKIWVRITAKPVDDSVAHHLDTITGDSIEGWLFSRSHKVPLYVFAMGDHVRWGVCKLVRDDVAAAFNLEEGIIRCGFRVRQPEGARTTLYFVFANLKSVKLILKLD